MEASDERKHFICHKVTDLITKNRMNNRLINREQNTVEGLKNNATIMGLPSDKERTTVVIDKSYHLQKVTTIPNYGRSYSYISTPTANQINKLLNHQRLQKKLQPTQTAMNGMILLS